MKYTFLPEVQNDTLFVLTGSPLPLLAGYLAAVNLWAFALMGVDKRRAKRKGARRIRERTLFLSALLGGSPGALLGMWTFRHKTKHWYFVWGMPLILAAQIALGIWIFRTI
ncbi:MAG: DUF1294 domain-containing protein [Oscillospiraceae bacterium]|nr:DUF1294 domain-containing protein [Oscillospiraceae bacterium]